MSESDARVVRHAADTHPHAVLYVGGLEESVNEASLHAAFIPCGDVTDVSIPLDHARARGEGGREGGMEGVSGKGGGGAQHRGFGFVEFAEREDAAAAMDNMNDAELFGRTLKVSSLPPLSLTHSLARSLTHSLTHAQGELRGADEGRRRREGGVGGAGGQVLRGGRRREGCWRRGRGRRGRGR